MVRTAIVRGTATCPEKDKLGRKKTVGTVGPSSWFARPKARVCLSSVIERLRWVVGTVMHGENESISDKVSDMLLAPLQPTPLTPRQTPRSPQKSTRDPTTLPRAHARQMSFFIGGGSGGGGGGQENRRGGGNGLAGGAGGMVGVSMQRENELLQKEKSRLGTFLSRPSDRGLGMVSWNVGRRAEWRAILVLTFDTRPPPPPVAATAEHRADSLETSNNNLRKELQEVKKEADATQRRFRILGTLISPRFVTFQLTGEAEKVRLQEQQIKRLEDRIRDDQMRQEERARMEARSNANNQRMAAAEPRESSSVQAAEISRLQQEIARLQTETTSSPAHGLRRAASHGALRSDSAPVPSSSGGADAATLLNANRQLESEAEASRRKIAHHETTICNLENEKMAIIKQRDRAIQERDANLKDAANEMREAAREMESQVDAMKKEAEKVRKENLAERGEMVRKLQASESEVATKNAALKKVKEELDFSKQTVEALQHKLQETEVRETKLRTELSQLSSSRDRDIAEAGERSRVLIQEKTKIESLLEASKEREALLKRADAIDPATVDNLEAEKRALASDAEDLRTRLAAADARVLALKGEVDAAKEATGEVERARNEVLVALAASEKKAEEAEQAASQFKEEAGIRGAQLMDQELTMEELRGIAESQEKIIEKIQSEAAEAAVAAAQREAESQETVRTFELAAQEAESKLAVSEKLAMETKTELDAVLLDKKQLESEIGHAIKTNDLLEVRAASAEEDATTWRAKAKKLEQDLAARIDEVKITREEIAALTKTLDAQKSALEQLQLQYDLTANRLELTESRLTSAESEGAVAVEELREARHRVASLESQVVELEAHVKTLQADVECGRQVMTSERVAQLQREEEREAQANALRHELENSLAKVKSLDSHTDFLQKDLEAKAQLLDQITADLESARADFARGEELLAAEVATSETLRSEKVTIEFTIARLDADLAAARADAAVARETVIARQAAFAALESDRAHHVATIASLKTDRDRYAETAADHKIDRDRLADVLATRDADLAAIAGKIGELDAECGALREELDAERKLTDCLRSELVAVRGSTEHELSEIRAEKEKIAADAAAALKEWEERYCTLEADLSRATRGADDATRAWVDAESANAALAREKEEALARGAEATLEAQAKAIALEEAWERLKIAEGAVAEERGSVEVLSQVCSGLRMCIVGLVSDDMGKGDLGLESPPQIQLRDELQATLSSTEEADSAAQAEIEAIRTQLTDSERRVHDLESNLETSSTTITALRASLETVTTSESDIRTLLESDRRRLADATETIDTLNTARAALEASETALKEKLENEKALRAAAEAEVGKLAFDLEVSEMNVDDLEKEKEACEAERSQLALEVQRLSSELRDQELRHTAVRKQQTVLAADSTSAVSVLSHELEEAKAHSDTLKADKDALQADLQAARKAESEASTRASAAQDALVSAQQDLAASHARIESLLDSERALTANIEYLTAALEAHTGEAVALAEQRGALEATCDTLRAEIATRAKERAAFVEEAARAVEDGRAYAQRVSDLDAALVTAEARLVQSEARFAAAVEDGDTLRGSLEESERRVEELALKRDDALLGEEEALRAVEIAKGKSSELEGIIEGLRQELADGVDKIAQFESDLGEKSAALAAALEAHIAETTAATEKLRILEASCDSLRAEHALEIAKRDEERDALVEEASRAANDARAHAQRALNVGADLAAAEALITEFEAKSAATSEENEVLRASLEESERRAGELVLLRDDALRRKEEFEKAVEVAEGRVMEIEERMRGLMQELADQGDKIEELKRLLDEKSGELSTARSQALDAEELARSVTAQRDELESAAFKSADAYQQSLTELHAARCERDDALERCAALSRRVEELESAMDETAALSTQNLEEERARSHGFETTIERIEAELARETALRAETQRVLDEAFVNAGALRVELQLTQDAQAAAERELADEVAHRDEAIAELTAKIEIHAQDAETMREASHLLEAQLREAEQERDMAKQGVETGKEAVHKLESELSTATAHAADLASQHAAKVDELAQVLQTAKLDAQALEHSLATAVEEADRERARAKAVAERNDELRHQLGREKEVVRDLEDASRLVESLEAKLSVASAAAAANEAERQKLVEQVSEQLAKSEEARERADRLAVQLTDETAEREQVAAELQQRRQDIQRLETELAKSVERADALERDAAHHASQLEAIRATIQAHSDRADELTAQLEHETAEAADAGEKANRLVATLRADLAAAVSQAAAFEQDRDTAATEAADLRAKLETRIHEAQCVEVQLSIETHERSKATDELKDIRAKLAEAVVRERDATAELEAARARLKEEAARVTDLSDQVARAQVAMDDAQEDSRRSIETLQAELAALTSQAAEFELERQSAGKDLVDLQGQCAAERERVDRLETQLVAEKEQREVRDNALADSVELALASERSAAAAAEELQAVQTRAQADIKRAEEIADRLTREKIDAQDAQEKARIALATLQAELTSATSSVAALELKQEMAERDAGEEREKRDAEHARVIELELQLAAETDKRQQVSRELEEAIERDAAALHDAQAQAQDANARADELAAQLAGEIDRHKEIAAALAHAHESEKALRCELNDSKAQATQRLEVEQAKAGDLAKELAISESRVQTLEYDLVVARNRADELQARIPETPDFGAHSASDAVQSEELERARARIAELEDEANKARHADETEVATVLAEVDRLTSQRDTAVEELNRIGTKLTEIEDEKRLLSQRLELVVQEAVEKDTQVKRFCADIDSLYTRIGQSDQVVEAKTRQIQILESDLSDCNHTIADLRRSVDLLEKETAQMKDERRNASTDADDARSRLEDELARVTEEWERAIEDKVFADGEIETLQSDLAAARAAQGGDKIIEALRAEEARLLGEVERLRERVAALERELSAAVSIGEDRAAVQALLAEARAEAEDQRAAAEATRAEATSQIAEMHETRASSELAEVARLHDETSILRSRVAELEAQLSDVRDANIETLAQVAELEATHELATTEILRLTKEAESHEAKSEALEAELADAREKMVAALSQVADMDVTRASAVSAQAEVHQLEERASMLHSKNEELVADLADAQLAKTNALASADSARAETLSLQTEAAALKSKTQVLEAELADAKAATADAGAKAAEMEALRDSALADALRLRDALATNESKSEELEADLADARAATASAKAMVAEMDAMRASAESAQAAKLQLEEEIAVLRSNCNALEAEILEVRTSIATAAALERTGALSCPPPSTTELADPRDSVRMELQTLPAAGKTEPSREGTPTRKRSSADPEDASPPPSNKVRRLESGAGKPEGWREEGETAESGEPDEEAVVQGTAASASAALNATHSSDGNQPTPATGAQLVTPSAPASGKPARVLRSASKAASSPGNVNPDAAAASEGTQPALATVAQPTTPSTSASESRISSRLLRSASRAAPSPGAGPSASTGTERDNDRQRPSSEKRGNVAEPVAAAVKEAATQETAAQQGGEQGEEGEGAAGTQRQGKGQEKGQEGGRRVQPMQPAVGVHRSARSVDGIALFFCTYGLPFPAG
ncbi:hypothetical protein BDK51DRAFT_41988, partial [Blyttiomyces helicus]